MSSAAIFGGNFDPVHNGHLITALKVKEELNLDKIIFIPASVSPFKTGVKAAPAVHRLMMLKIAIAEIPCFTYSDIEIKSGGVSFTIETLRKLKEEYNNLHLVIGYDNLVEFPKWKEPDEVIKLAQLVVLQRAINYGEDRENKYFDSAIFPQTPVIEISSTEIRNRVKKSLPIDFLVPEGVKEYIYKNNLYKD